MPKHRRKDGVGGKSKHTRSKAKKQPATIPHALRKHKDKNVPCMEVRKSRPAPYSAPPANANGNASRWRRAETQRSAPPQNRGRNVARRNMQKAMLELEERAAAADSAGRRPASSSFVLTPASFSVAAVAPVRQAHDDTPGSTTDLQAALEQDARETQAWAQHMADASAAENTRRNRAASRRAGAEAQSNAFAALAGSDSDSSDDEKTANASVSVGSAPAFQLRAATFTAFPGSQAGLGPCANVVEDDDI